MNSQREPRTWLNSASCNRRDNLSLGGPLYSSEREVYSSAYVTRLNPVRIGPGLLAKADARAAQLGLDRACYVRSLIERDAENDSAAPGRRFASEDLVGRFRLGGRSATNQRVRENLRRRARHETDR